jgi:CRP-like cAMP-binding protein
MMNRRTAQPDYLDLLRQTWLFSECSTKELRAIASLCTPIDIDAGRVLIHEGDLGRECAVVLSGHAVTERGHEIIGQVGANAVVGTLALVEKTPHTATVTAATAMELLVMDRRAFASLASGAMGWSVKHRIEVLAIEQRRQREEVVHAPLLMAQPVPSDGRDAVTLAKVFAHA